VGVNDEQPPDDAASDGLDAGDAMLVAADPEPSDVIATARRRHGAAGAIVAAGMLGLDQVLSGRKPREEAPIVVASPTEPTDLDQEGIAVPIDDTRAAWAPPQPTRDPFPALRPRRRR